MSRFLGKRRVGINVVEAKVEKNADNNAANLKFNLKQYDEASLTV